MVLKLQKEILRKKLVDVMATLYEMDKQSVQDLHHTDPATVEYFRKIFVCLRYDDGLPEALMEVDQIVRMEPMVVQCFPEPEGQVGGPSLRFCCRCWVGMVSPHCQPPQP